MEQATEKTTAVKYAIDLAWYELNNRSFATVAQSRMCRSCQAKLGNQVEETYVALDPTGKQVISGRRMTAYGTNPLVTIRDCCSRARGYITANMTVMEIVFRVLLARANQPLMLEELRNEMESWAGEAERIHFLSLPALQRMLESDRHYGLRRLEVSAVEA